MYWVVIKNLNNLKNNKIDDASIPSFTTSSPLSNIISTNVGTNISIQKKKLSTYFFHVESGLQYQQQGTLVIHVDSLSRMERDFHSEKNVLLRFVGR